MMPHIFGIRHLSPASAHHVLHYLNEIKPTAVLIEGPSDATHLIPEIVHPKTKPPIAIMAYTQEVPIQTILYPFAHYSAEYQAMKWAVEEGVHVEFMDLPTDVTIALDKGKPSATEREIKESVFDQVATLADEHDYESFWERSFEHVVDSSQFVDSIHLLSTHLRELVGKEDSSFEQGVTHIRESFMKKQINRVLKEGHSPERVVVVTGSFHVDALKEEYKEESLSVPDTAKTNVTLMPYTNYRLSSYSGYGAGNAAPAYFHHMWTYMQENDRTKLPIYYLSSIANALRQSGTFRSAAEVIEGVRLAYALSSFRSEPSPTLKDLRDAATVTMGQGDFSVIADACATIEIGNMVGSLPDGVSQTSIQEDFSRQLKRLKLEKYRSTTAQVMELDIRENRRAKKRETAFLDLERSFFFHRLQLLNIEFAKPVVRAQDDATWAEKWEIKWTPTVEIELIEAILQGETIELATAFVFKERLKSCDGVAAAAEMVRLAYQCGMPHVLKEARGVLQELATDTGNFVDTSQAIRDIGYVIRYGDIRQTDISPLHPIMTQLFLHATLLLVPSSACNNEFAHEMMGAIQSVHMIALEQFESVDDELWHQKLEEVAERDNLNPLLSGYACAILIERNRLTADWLSREVSRRLSPGIPVDLGTGWFEGLCMRNKYALLSRTFIWEEMDHYISSLDEDEFRRAIVFLRRAFMLFSTSDRSKIAEILGSLWGTDELQTAEHLASPLSEEEESMLDDLNDFDFGDF
ncbi:DUF5682 family protein [Priestia koreensis]|uniref:DUF5682 family protein n=1 Tax=Priestia koreensis TaxID=284581 RepID=UPI00345B1666